MQTLNLESFINAAKANPKVASEILNALLFDIGMGYSALNMLQDDVKDDPNYH